MLSKSKRTITAETTFDFWCTDKFDNARIVDNKYLVNGIHILECYKGTRKSAG